MSHGVNPNLGRSSKSRVNTVDLRLHSVKANTSASAGENTADASLPLLDRVRTERAVSPRSDAFPSSIRQEPSQSLMQEEVLMYNRAASRLNEICRVVVV